ncbi:hypothetical protein NUW54_g8190 [Trametes sanguinea]|uniref:Uncharacterized protein n=1 Tax=Trametes sanguinea TaxID=158606 RepID=A0ACC1PG61_9APHY|nr:hypothetical protein NUW54_g8190 [Trametes sanguinea]
MNRDVPSFSLTVAYREFAKGQLCLLQRPVTLYSFLQKFCVVVLHDDGSIRGERSGHNAAFKEQGCTHLTLYEQNWVLITDHITSSLCIAGEYHGRREPGETGRPKRGYGRGGEEVLDFGLDLAQLSRKSGSSCSIFALSSSWKHLSTNMIRSFASTSITPALASLPSPSRLRLPTAAARSHLLHPRLPSRPLAPPPPLPQPLQPTVAISLHTLEFYHQLRRRQSSFSVQAMVKVLCALHNVTYAQHL